MIVNDSTIFRGAKLYGKFGQPVFAQSARAAGILRALFSRKFFRFFVPAEPSGDIS